MNAWFLEQVAAQRMADARREADLARRAQAVPVDDPELSRRSQFFRGVRVRRWAHRPAI
jgi:hypothetical protein